MSGKAAARRWGGENAGLRTWAGLDMRRSYVDAASECLRQSWPGLQQGWAGLEMRGAWLERGWAWLGAERALVP